MDNPFGDSGFKSRIWDDIHDRMDMDGLDLYDVFSDLCDILNWFAQVELTQDKLVAQARTEAKAEARRELIRELEGKP